MNLDPYFKRYSEIKKSQKLLKEELVRLAVLETEIRNEINKLLKEMGLPELESHNFGFAGGAGGSSTWGLSYMPLTVSSGTSMAQSIPTLNITNHTVS